MKGIDLTKIFDSMKQNDISELVIKEGSRLYEIRRGGFKHKIVSGNFQEIPSSQGFAHTSQPVQIGGQIQQTTNLQSTQKTNVSEPVNEQVSSNLHEIKSPLVGTYYSSPKPDAPHFVELGSKIRKGQTICIVEAMKNFNEIESDVDGIVREICVKNEELVEFGKVLLRVELS